MPSLAVAQAAQDDLDAENEQSDNTPDGGQVIGVPSPDDNKIMKMIDEAAVSMDALDQEATLINAKRKEIRERLEAAGINRWAFGHARQVMSMKESKRQGMDLSYLLCRKALKDPVQTDWLASPE